MSMLDEITDSQIEFYNAKLEAARLILSENGIEVSEDELGDKAREILSGTSDGHSYQETDEPTFEQLDG